MKKTKNLLNTFLFCFLTFGLFAQTSSPIFVSLDYNSNSICPGNQLCASVRMFTNEVALTAIDLDFGWNSDFLSFESIKDTERAYPIDWTIAENVTTTQNSLLFSWSSETPITTPQTIFFPFEICWTVENNFTSNEEAQVEITTANFYNGAAIYEAVSHVSESVIQAPNIEFENQYVTLDVNEICIPITTYQFYDITAAEFSIEWDKDILSYKSVNLANSEFNGLSEDDFSVYNEGKLGVNWTALNNTPLDLDSDINSTGRALMYEVCFDIVATDEVLTYVNLIEDNPDFPNTITTPCEEEIAIASRAAGSVRFVGEGISIEFPDTTISTNTDFLCVPMHANNLQDLIGMQLTMAWDSEVLQFSNLEFNQSVLPNLGPQNFNTNFNGYLNMSWIDASLLPITINEDDIIFETCFNVIGQAGDESQIYLGGDTLGIITEIIGVEVEPLPMLSVPGTVRIRDEGRFILPGDANEDKQADHFDLLHIGLGYNAFGTERANNDIQWERKYSRDWGEDSPVSKVNYKHSDTNGDSQVDRQDVEAIIQNWGEMEDVAGNGYEPSGYIGEASLLIDETAANLGQDMLELPILLGTETMPTEGAYGIAFSISYEYDGGLAEQDWASILVEDSWLGTPEEDLISIYRHFPEQQRIDVALTRLDRIARGGSGQIATLSIVVEDLILLINQPQGGASKTLNFNIHDVRLINENEEEIQVADSQISVQVDATTGLSILEDSAIRIYPTIANSRLHIASDETIEQAILLNMDGKQLDVIDHPESMLNVASLENGMYLLHLITEDGLSTKKFSIIK